MTRTQDLGGLRQKVRSGEIRPHQALHLLATLKSSGYYVKPSVVEWLRHRRATS